MTEVTFFCLSESLDERRNTGMKTFCTSCVPTRPDACLARQCYLSHNHTHYHLYPSFHLSHDSSILTSSTHCHTFENRSSLPGMPPTGFDAPLPPVLLVQLPNSSSAETCGVVVAKPEAPGTMLWFASEPEPRSELPQPKSLEVEVVVGLAAAEDAGGSAALHALLPQTSLLAQLLEAGGGEVAGARGGAAAESGGDFGPDRLKMESDG